MSTSGAGRGRGWLNLEKNKTKDIPKPGLDLKPNPCLPSHSSNCNETEIDYADLIKVFGHLNFDDDGIMLNQKIRHIIEYWTKTCENESEVKESFNAIHQECLKSEELATKFTFLMMSNTFANLKQKISNVTIRQLFISQLQRDFEDREVLKSSDKSMFYNSIKMFCFFFNNRLKSERPMGVSKRPAILYVDMIIKEPALDVKALAQLVCLLKNFSEDKSKNDLDTTLKQVGREVRLLLISNKPLELTYKLWLLFTLDLLAYRHMPLDCYWFYQEHLGEKEISSFTFHPNYVNLERNVLESKNEWKNLKLLFMKKINEQEALELSSSDNTSNSDLSQCEQSDRTSSSGFVSNDSQTTQPQAIKVPEKIGRPILGVGARLNKPKVSASDHSHDSNNSLNQITFETNSLNKSKPSKRNEGWEHDDRLENDYS